MPPKRPAILQSFFAGICRNLSLDLWRRKNTGKRGRGETELALEELSECISAPSDPEEIVEEREPEAAVGKFIHSLPDYERRTFLARYYFMLPIKEIAKRQNEGLSKTKMCLYRTREKLAQELKRRAYAKRI